MQNRLAEMRRTREWTQQDLADQVGVTRQTIISLEGGRYNPSIVLAFRLARLFGVNIEDVFVYTGEDEDA